MNAIAIEQQSDWAIAWMGTYRTITIKEKNEIAQKLWDEQSSSEQKRDFKWNECIN